VLVIHGGAGTILKKKYDPGQREAYMDGLQEALARVTPSCNGAAVHWMQ